MRRVRYSSLRRKVRVKTSSKRKHHLKGKHKIYHTIKGKRVSGIYYKGRFYSRRHHLKKGHRIHHTIKHNGVDWHAVSSKVATSVGSAWNYVKRKRNDYKEYRARKRYYKENLSAAEREQVRNDSERKNPYAVKGSRDRVSKGESKRLARQRKYDYEEREKEKTYATYDSNGRREGSIRLDSEQAETYNEDHDGESSI